MKRKNLIVVLSIIALLVLVASCATQEEKQKEIKNVPQQGFDIHLDAKHFLKGSRTTVHHYCKPINDEVIECLIFDKDAKDAKLVGVETIVANDAFATFPEETKWLWHDHSTELIEGEATLPDMPKEEAEKLVNSVKQTHGRVVYVWDFVKDDYPSTLPFMDANNGNAVCEVKEQ